MPHSFCRTRRDPASAASGTGPDPSPPRWAWRRHTPVAAPGRINRTDVRATDGVARMMSRSELFESRIQRSDDGCWIWTGRQDGDGYGRMWNSEQNGNISAHRFAYEKYVGPIPEGMGLDHLCRVRNCVNPEHLEPVTCHENQIRSPITIASVNAKKTHCPKGHPYSGSNLYINTASGGRCCRTCNSQAGRRANKERPAA